MVIAGRKCLLVLLPKFIKREKHVFMNYLFFFCSRIKPLGHACFFFQKNKLGLNSGLSNKFNYLKKEIIRH